ncbi:MFS transporter [Alkalibacter mobilis]|uniref:MFS transporter n=1 Tax=Alkalibacter mobilis TaxID=2787712 RepID=UPI00189F1A20|nr:MFS transporter [Alkalibacter mobilis]MBF7095625.1 MFS transporter [Alkalibacter mobilis]
MSENVAKSSKFQLTSARATAYGTAEIGFGLMMQVAVSYYTYFLTDIALLGPAIVGTMLLINRIVDAISVPLTGAIIEKSNLPWGKYRSWLMIAPAVVAICFILMFRVPEGMNEISMAIYFSVFYMLGHIFVNFSYSARFALLPAMGNTPESRIMIAGRTNQMNTTSRLLFSLISLPIIIALGGEATRNAKGFFLYMLIFATFNWVTYMVSAAAAKPVDVPGRWPQKNVPTFGEMIKQVVTNKYLIILMLAELGRFTAALGLASFAVFFYQYVAGDMSLVSMYFLSLTLGGLVGNLLGPQIAKKMGTKKTYVIGLSGQALFLVLAYFIGRAPMAFLVLSGLASVSSGFGFSISGAVYSDCADYAEWKTGKSAKGIVMSLSAFPIKVAMVISGSVSAYALAAIGYVGGMDPTPAIQSGIAVIATIIPAVAAVFGFICINFYNLKQEDLKKMKDEIQERQDSVA